MNNTKHHFLLVSCPSQGHVNPTLQLAKLLIQTGGGTRVTYATTVRGLTQVKSLPSLQGLSFATFSDGFDDGVKPTHDPDLIMSEFKRVGSRTLTALIQKLSASSNGGGDGEPVTFLIYAVLLPWAAQVAADLGIPSAFYCIQSTTSFALSHHYFTYFHKCHSVPSSITIDGLPPFAPQELPSYLLPSSQHATFVPTLQEHFQVLEQVNVKPYPNFVLLNTFDALEEAAMEAIRSHMKNANVVPVAVGPLVSSSSDAGFRCDLFDKSRDDDYLQWLDGKPDCSVVYVSFGSMVVLKRDQIEEMMNGLVDSGLQFLWVIRASKNGDDRSMTMMIEERLKSTEQGLVVPWCSQVEVLGHRSVGCFVTHCGWNSTLESLVAGVPTVCCPQFSDQNTNAKLVEEVWGTGVRAKSNHEGVTEGGEIKRCLEIVMRGEEIKRNCQKWKGLANEALNANNYNLRHFIAGLG
ncbi:phloretin 4'-O-glucosyltransferase-like [Pyrus communis]|uniref:phloretin 4'-O-glucosyltransferase-like n=1 Tax=Pyrus communis TaxID=23211 RepID=UPI0035BF0802